MIVAGLSLLDIFRQAGWLAWIAALTFIAGNLMALIRNVVWLAVTLELAPAYTNAEEDVQAILATVGDTLI